MGLLYWGPCRICKEVSGNGQLSSQGPIWGTRRGIPLPGTLSDSKRDLLMERLSVWDLCEGALEVGLLYRES